MRKRLGKIPKMTAIGTKFLRVEAEMVGVPQKLFKEQLRFFQIARSSETFDVPK
jgi:hypothetical protein